MIFNRKHQKNMWNSFKLFYPLSPGPDLVICDEGHILKNEVSAVSKAMNSIRTRRRIVLTGTPLQNNLVECENFNFNSLCCAFSMCLKLSSLLSDHCMVNFIKENLLGSLKEFRNRFINPIQNGQCADSTAQDVRLMKKRAHILYEMLAGCVQVMLKRLKWFFIVICSSVTFFLLFP